MDDIGYSAESTVSEVSEGLKLAAANQHPAAWTFLSPLVTFSGMPLLLPNPRT